MADEKIVNEGIAVGRSTGSMTDGTNAISQNGSSNDKFGGSMTDEKAYGDGNGIGVANNKSDDERTFEPLVCVVDFHHARGPEIETWINLPPAYANSDPAAQNKWEFLPFMALSDGAHASTEDFSYFTLRYQAPNATTPTSVFGVACTRQIQSSALIDRPADVTRSTVQKAVVAIVDSPWVLGRVREKLGAVTEAWFAQRDFKEIEILKNFHESLAADVRRKQDDQYLGLLLRELIYEFRHQTLVMFKCCLLQPKMLFFGSRCERLCMVQFALLSLIPGLLARLEDCADPEFNSYEHTVVKSSSLKTSDRNSLLAYMGLPLQLFGKGAMFCPYIPLQELDVLADHDTKSYMVGSTNSLLLQQKDRHSDILINLDDSTVDISSTSLRAALSLSVADRRWIDFLTKTVLDSWDESNPSQPKTMGYMGSEEFIRLQFEEYILALISSVKYNLYLQQPNASPMASVEGDPIQDFGLEWTQAWQQTPSFALFNRITDSQLFDIVEPRHPTAGNLTIDDVQRRISQQIQTLHLDERFASSKETFNKHLTSSQRKVSTAFANFWADVEALREAQQQQRKPSDASGLAATDGTMGRSPHSRSASPAPSTGSASSRTNTPGLGVQLASRAPDIANSAQASVHAAGQKASAFMSSWGSWASEKKKEWAERQHVQQHGVGTRSSSTGGSVSSIGQTTATTTGTRSSTLFEAEAKQT